MSRHRSVPIVIGVMALVVLGFVGSLMLPFGGAATDSADRVAPPTATVVMTDLVAVEVFTGVVETAGRRPLPNRLQGTVTALPGIGDVIAPGEVLYAVDELPVILLAGETPAYRTLREGDSGRDVEQLERALVELGFDEASTLTIDQTFDSDTAAAVVLWQESIGLEPSGLIELGRVIFSPGDLRVVTLLTAVGEVATGSVLEVSRTERVVVVVADADEAAEFLIVGDAVKVELPGGESVEGTVRRNVAVPTAPMPGARAQSRVEIELRRRLPATVGTDASVVVRSERIRAQETLAVPIAALLATVGGGLAVERFDRGQIVTVDVEAGAFAEGLVEISGDLRVGDLVVVPR